MAKDDIVVGLKVKLDEESVAREAEKAGEKMGGGRSRGGGDKRVSSVTEGLRDAVVKPIADRISKIEDKLGGLGAGAGAAAAGGIAIFGAKILQEIYYSLKAVLASIWSLSQSLVRFTPVLSVAFRELQLAMRIMAVDLGRLTGKELANLVRLMAEIISLLYTALRPVIKVLAMYLSMLVDAVRSLVNGIKFAIAVVLYAISNLIRAIGKLITWLGTYVPGVVGSAMRSMGLAAEALAKVVDAHAKSIQQSTSSNRNAVHAMNMALIRGLSTVGKMPYTGVTAPGQSDERDAPVFSAPLKADSHGAIRVHNKSQQGSSSAAGRQAVSFPAPTLASVVNNVQLTAEVKLQHEEAVQSAIEEVRGCLVKAIHQVRNEQIMLSSKIYGRTVVDL